MTQKPKKQKPKKQNPDWEKLEIIVKEIQEQLSPEATVRHDHRVIGKSGSERKLDVSISQTISSFPVFIVFDCKHASKDSKLVKLKDVEAFIGQLEDVEATHGVMVSNTGFDAGAKRKARLKNIFLQIFRNANETDWRAVFGEIVGIAFAHVTMPQVRTTAFLVGNSSMVEIPSDIQIYDENGKSVGTIETLFLEGWKQDRQPIAKKFKIYFNKSPGFIKINDKNVQIQEVEFKIKMVAKKYLVNLKIAEGKILEDEDTKKIAYRSLTTEGIDWAEILNSQSGIEINNDEYQQILNNGTLVDDLGNRKRYLKIVTEEKGSQD